MIYYLNAQFICWFLSQKREICKKQFINNISWKNKQIKQYTIFGKETKIKKISKISKINKINNIHGSNKIDKLKMYFVTLLFHIN